MEVKVKTIENSLGQNKALLIKFKNRAEFDEFLSLAKPAREESLEMASKDNCVSGIDDFLTKMEKSYMERPIHKGSKQLDCTCMIFSNDFPDLFWAFYDAIGTFFTIYPCKKYLDASLKKNLKDDK